MYKSLYQSLHQLFGYTENFLFSYECNKMNKIHVLTFNSDPYQYKI